MEDEHMGFKASKKVYETHDSLMERLKVDEQSRIEVQHDLFHLGPNAYGLRALEDRLDLQCVAGAGQPQGLRAPLPASSAGLAAAAEDLSRPGRVEAVVLS